MSMNKGNLAAIDLTNYPLLLSLRKRDPQRVSELIKQAVKEAENRINEAPKDEVTKEIFGMGVEDVQKLFLEVFFDYKQIIQPHHDPKEKALMTVLGDENHPLAIFYKKTLPFTATGEPIEYNEFVTSENVRDFFQDFLYALRFCSMKDLTGYLMLGEFDLVEHMKLHNVKALIDIQPALQYQKDNNIPVGKRIPFTGFFDCGQLALLDRNICPVCKMKEKLYKVMDHVFCQSCKAGFKSNT